MASWPDSQAAGWVRRSAVAAILVLASGCAGGADGSSGANTAADAAHLETKLSEMSKKVVLLEEERRQLLSELEARAAQNDKDSGCRLAALPAGSDLDSPGEAGLQRRQHMSGETDSLPIVKLSNSESGSVQLEQRALVKPPLGDDSPSEAGAKVELAAPLLLSGGADSELFDEGQEALHRHEYYQAERQLSRFLQQNPRHPFVDDALVLRGEARRLSQRSALALEDFQTVIDRYPDELRTPDAWLGLARVRLSLGQVDGARQAFLALCEKFPQSGASMEVPEEYRP